MSVNKRAVQIMVMNPASGSKIVACGKTLPSHIQNKDNRWSILHMIHTHTLKWDGILLLLINLDSINISSTMQANDNKIIYCVIFLKLNQRYYSAGW
jgi:hypothetical protein